MAFVDPIRQRQFPGSALSGLGTAAGIVFRDLQAGSPHMEGALQWGGMSLSCGWK